MEERDEFEIPLERTSEIPAVAGTHRLILTRVDRQYAKASGSPMLVWYFRINEEGPDDGKTVKPLYIVLDQNSRWKLDQLLNAFGAPQTGKVKPEALIDREILAEIKHTEFEGRVQAEIGKTMPLSSKNIGPGTKKDEAPEPESDIPF
jgi:hypothetical protein